MPLIERRYAEALVNISVSKGAVEDYKNEYQYIAGLYENNQDFKLFMLNPEIKPDTKKELITKVFTGNIKQELLNFLLVLIDKDRINLLPGIFSEFTRLADKKNNVLNLTIISAEQLSDEQIGKLKEKFRKLYNASNVHAKLEIDKSVLGGLKVRIEDKIVDGTIKGRLDALRELLMK